MGGLDLGLERAGMRVAWQCEADPVCRAVLQRHWPHVPIYEDVAHVDRHAPWVDLVCGGFPCQPVSEAGHRRAHEDERWLWPQFARVVRVLRPRYVLVENVPGLLARGMGDVVGDLAALRYDAEWDSVSASAVGSPQKRERVFVVAYPAGVGPEARRHVFPDAARSGSHEQGGLLAWSSESARGASGRVRRVPDAGLHGMAYGVPDGLDRLRLLGNAVVPQIAEWLGRRILEADVRAAA